jgi:cytoskeleton protein RodZ
VVILLLIGAAILFWLPQSVFDRVGDSVTRLPRDAPGQRADTASKPAPRPRPETPPVAAVTEAATPTGTATAPSVPVVAPPPVTPVPVAEPPAATVSNDPIVFVSREDVWISVTGDGRKQRLRRIVKAGETVGVNGAPPFSVVIGRATSVEVQVHGQPYDLKPVTRPGGVASFEVKQP